MKDLLSSKTFWTCVGGVITAVGGYFTGELSSAAALQLAFTSLIGIFLREGVRKSGPTV